MKEVASSVTRGKILRKFLLELIKHGNFQRVDAVMDNKKHLMQINDVVIQVKTSCIWGKQKIKSYMFQQLRKDDYDILICFGISPYNAHCWVVKKSLIIDSSNEWILGRAKKQHNSESRWLQINPKKIPEWLQPLGGDLNKALAALKDVISNG